MNCGEMVGYVVLYMSITIAIDPNMRYSNKEGVGETLNLPKNGVSQCEIQMNAY